jgi:hypothetical protein
MAHDLKMLEMIGALVAGKSPICPVMSSQTFLPVASKVVATDGVAVTVPITPCVGVHCGMAIKDQDGGFRGCGFAPGKDIADLTVAVGALSNLVALHKEPIGAGQIYQNVGSMLVAVEKQVAAVADLIRELLKRMAEKPAAKGPKDGQ